MINKIYNENNIDIMKRIPDNFISGIITSPPYNITTKRKDYIGSELDKKHYDIAIKLNNEFID